MKVHLNPARRLFPRDARLYGHFLEHFHRQIYGGVYQPHSPLSDADGFRLDVIEALRNLRTPVIRWPGGCFVSAYHWQKGVGPRRVAYFDKAWRVEEPNAFGTDEFLKLCEKIGCESYICANAGTGSAEEISDWVEYCNLDGLGEFARLRAQNGRRAPYGVQLWSIGNENYGDWEIGAKDAREWARFVLEAAKMVKRVDPTVRLSAAALDDFHWNAALLQSAGSRLDFISLHAYWDKLHQVEAPASYEQCMAYTQDLEAPIRRARGLLQAMGLEKRIKIAFDEWNLRGWHHPNVHTLHQAVDEKDYLDPRDKNDVNATYTMADAVFSACFLNALLRNADAVAMANFAPVVNTRGALYVHPRGIVKRSTYYVFELYANLLGDQIVDCYLEDNPLYRAGDCEVPLVDAVATVDGESGGLRLALINKHPESAREATLCFAAAAPIGAARMITLAGESCDDYNDVDRERVRPRDNGQALRRLAGGGLQVLLPAHSVNIVQIG